MNQNSKILNENSSKVNKPELLKNVQPNLQNNFFGESTVSPLGIMKLKWLTIYSDLLRFSIITIYW